MPTSMLDALAAEAKEITLLGAEASRLAIDALRRSSLLTQQITRLAKEEGLAPPSISADADDAEFLAFQAEHFPDVVFGAGNENSNSPGDPPAAQTDGQGNQGSHEPAPGGAEACVQVECEQVSADTVSGEQGLTVVCKDPETGPDARGTLSNRVLDWYGTTDLDPREIAKRVGSTAAAVNEFIRQGRKNQNRLAAQGDLRRDIGVEVALAARAGSNRPKPSDLPMPAAAPVKPVPTPPAGGAVPDGNLCELDLKDCKVTYRDQTIQLIRAELRLVLILNDQVPTPWTRILDHCRILSVKSLRRDIDKINPRLAEIGVEIYEPHDKMFALRLIPVA